MGPIVVLQSPLLYSTSRSIGSIGPAMSPATPKPTSIPTKHGHDDTLWDSVCPFIREKVSSIYYEYRSDDHWRTYLLYLAGNATTPWDLGVVMSCYPTHSTEGCILHGVSTRSSDQPDRVGRSFTPSHIAILSGRCYMSCRLTPPAVMLLNIYLG